MRKNILFICADNSCPSIMAVFLLNPNHDIENTYISQSLDTSRKSKKWHITNKVS